MGHFIANIPIVRDLATLVEILLLLNVVLTGAVILLAFRASRYKAEAEELEARLNETIGSTIAEHTPEQTVPRRQGRRSS